MSLVNVFKFVVFCYYIVNAGAWFKLGGLKGASLNLGWYKLYFFMLNVLLKTEKLETLEIL